MIDFKSPNTPSKAMPSSRNGNNINQTIGYNTKAKIARGQQKINRRIQTMKVIMH
ncbi:MAG TPA: hypothetical protein VN726_05875 [Hanamia sp.]|nr:hypothetical protein [Hanamia sp.]